MAGSSNGASALRPILWLIVVAACVATGAFWFTTSRTAPPPRIALVTADQTAYWERLIEGAQAAADDLGVQLTIEQPDGTMDNQIDVLDRLLAAGYDGIGVSPVDAVKQGITLRKVAASSRLVTVDSDSEYSGRICFVGADNYAMGRQCGELIKQAMPDGARIAIVMGPIEKENGERRRQGLIDELLDRSYGPGRPVEPIDEEHSNGTYTVAVTLIDAIDPAAAKANAVAALTEDPSINCIVGLFGYSTPSALDALAELDRDDVTVVGFDDDPATLAAVKDGRVFATIAQDQFNYGFNTIELLARAANDQAHIAIPITERVHFPPLVVTADTVETFGAGRR